MMNSAVGDWLRIGLAAMTFILVGKLIFVSFNVPVLSKAFAAA